MSITHDQSELLREWDRRARCFLLADKAAEFVFGNVRESAYFIAVDGLFDAYTALIAKTIDVEPDYLRDYLYNKTYADIDYLIDELNDFA